MKKIFVLLSLIVLATSCDWFVFDNQEYYNASVAGKITDAKTGLTFPVQVIYGSAFAGKTNVKVAFKYVSTTSFAPTWEIKTVSIK